MKVTSAQDNEKPTLLTIICNDQILCGNLASTYYVVTPMKDSPLRCAMANPSVRVVTKTACTSETPQPIWNPTDARWRVSAIWGSDVRAEITSVTIS